MSDSRPSSALRFWQALQKPATVALPPQVTPMSAPATPPSGVSPVGLRVSFGSGALHVSSLIGGKQLRPVAVVAEKPGLEGRLLNGIPVHSPRNLEELLVQVGAKRILLAIPSVPCHARLQVIRRPEILPVHVQT